VGDAVLSSEWKDFLAGGFRRSWDLDRLCTATRRCPTLGAGDFVAELEAKPDQALISQESRPKPNEKSEQTRCGARIGIGVNVFPELEMMWNRELNT
jgi:hypothetical protein